MSGTIPEEEEGPPRWWHRVENGILVVVLAAMVIGPVAAVLVRWVTGVGLLAGVNEWVQALNLWVEFIGGAVAARTGQHLALSTGTILNIRGRAKAILAGFTSAVATAVTAYLAYASVTLVMAETASALSLWGGVPKWVMECIMPVGFLVMALRFAWHQNDTWAGRGAALAAVVATGALVAVPAGDRSWVVWSGAGVLMVAVAFGAPLFTAMGGIGMLLFYGEPVPVALSAVPSATVQIISDPSLVSLPLFTLAGYLLAEGGASKRLVQVFNVWFGWLPGGVAAAAVLVCAFFTTFTGASGVTILALGGLLLPALEEAGYPRHYAIGLLAASGSIGLLFPPSLPVILYGVQSHVPITDLFIGGLVPGTLLVSLLVGMSVVVGLRQHGLAYYTPGGAGASDVSFGEATRKRGVEMLEALWFAKWEMALPIVVIGGIFGGLVTIFEAAAFTALYAFLIEVVIHRTLSLRKGVPEVVVETAALMGGVLIILGVALGFTSYLVDAQVPEMVRDWVQASVSNRLVFILMLNVLLLLVGCLMDIYSAIVVVVPLIIPVAQVYGIHPVHLGILFLANLELGYLTPPVGLNLFLASFRFKEPLAKVYKDALPFLGMMTVGVLIIAYVPIATLWHFPDEAPAPQPNFFEDLDQKPPPKPGEATAPDKGGIQKLSPEQLQQMLEDSGTPPAPAPATP